MEVLHRIKLVLDSGDPIIRSFFLLDSYYNTFLCSLTYVLLVKWILPYIMRNRKPFELRKTMIVYNFFLVFMYSSTILQTIGLFMFTDFSHTMCTPSKVVRGEWTYYAARIAWCVYLLKIVEYADTIFFVLRKKDYLVTNLHVIHHATLPIIGFVFLRSETSTIQAVPALINTVIHIIMYTYYGLAAMGPEMQKYLWWKKHLTKLQMYQFVIIILFISLVVPFINCETSTHGIYMSSGFALLFLVLFYNFYIHTYKPRSKNKRSGENVDVVKDNVATNGHINILKPNSFCGQDHSSGTYQRSGNSESSAKTI